MGPQYAGAIRHTVTSLDFPGTFHRKAVHRENVRPKVGQMGGNIKVKSYFWQIWTIASPHLEFDRAAQLLFQNQHGVQIWKVDAKA